MGRMKLVSVILIFGALGLLVSGGIVFLVSNYTYYPGWSTYQGQINETFNPSAQQTFDIGQRNFPIKIFVGITINATGTTNCSIIVERNGQPHYLFIIQASGQTSRNAADALVTLDLPKTGNFKVIIRNDGAVSFDVTNGVIYAAMNQTFESTFTFLFFIGIILGVVGIILFFVARRRS